MKCCSRRYWAGEPDKPTKKSLSFHIAPILFQIGRLFSSPSDCNICLRVIIFLFILLLLLLFLFLYWSFPLLFCVLSVCFFFSRCCVPIMSTTFVSRPFVSRVNLCGGVSFLSLPCSVYIDSFMRLSFVFAKALAVLKTVDVFAVYFSVPIRLMIL